MSQIYVYVDGSNLWNVEELLITRFQKFLTTWGVDSARVINEKYPRTPDLHAEDLPDWNLGINLDVVNLSRSRIEELVKFLNELATESDCEFVIGTANFETGITDDLCFVGRNVKPQTVGFLVEQFG
jgi:hypothetical protein